MQHQTTRNLIRPTPRRVSGGEVPLHCLQQRSSTVPLSHAYSASLLILLLTLPNMPSLHRLRGQSFALIFLHHRLIPPFLSFPRPPVSPGHGVGALPAQLRKLFPLALERQCTCFLISAASSPRNQLASVSIFVQDEQVVVLVILTPQILRDGYGVGRRPRACPRSSVRPCEYSDVLAVDSERWRSRRWRLRAATPCWYVVSVAEEVNVMLEMRMCC